MSDNKLAIRLKKILGEEPLQNFVYELREYTESNEIHIFESLPKKLTRYKPKSCCTKVNRSDTTLVSNTELTADQARKKAANIGYEVCGSCVSHLYVS